jgi:phage N-6-adenine-methyltransferase
VGTEIIGQKVGVSNSIEYSTPLAIVAPLISEFGLNTDVCASDLNHKLPNYFTKEDDALQQKWAGNCWMNPPFNRYLGVWVKKAFNETYSNQGVDGTKVCLIPVRSNTKWWADVCQKAEIRFINGEVNFNDEPRGLWWPMCIMIFGEKAKIGNFSVIDYRIARNALEGKDD